MEKVQASGLALALALDDGSDVGVDFVPGAPTQADGGVSIKSRYTPFIDVVSEAVVENLAIGEVSSVSTRS